MALELDSTSRSGSSFGLGSAGCTLRAESGLAESDRKGADDEKMSLVVHELILGSAGTKSLSDEPAPASTSEESWELMCAGKEGVLVRMLLY